LTIIVMGAYHFWKSIWLMTERNVSGSWSPRLNSGEDKGDWLGGLKF